MQNSQQELINAIRGVFRASNGQAPLADIERLITAFFEHGCLLASSKKAEIISRRNYASRLYAQHLPTYLINERLRNAFGISRATAWRDINAISRRPK